MEETLNPTIGRGVRFAPSPTGRFHVGNLRTAWLSHEWARAWGEPWVVRFEDIDSPRTLVGAQALQLADMATLGLVPDQIVVQSDLRARHWDVFLRAVGERRVYPCFCSRKEVREALESAASAPHGGAPTYSGYCRERLALAPKHECFGLPTIAWRFAVGEDPSGRSDFIVARSTPELNDAGGLADPTSFVPAYHWACSIDDWDGDYRLLVRAWDLAEILPQHRTIMKWLGESEGKTRLAPAVFHTALVTQRDGHRLEKRTQGVTLSELTSAGVDAREVRARFERSVRGASDGNVREVFAALAREWEPGKVWGEDRRVMSVTELRL